MDGLHSGAVYEELVSVRLVGMMLIIVVKQELRKNVIRYATQAVGTGALNFMVIEYILVIDTYTIIQNKPTHTTNSFLCNITRKIRMRLITPPCFGFTFCFVGQQGRCRRKLATQRSSHLLCQFTSSRSYSRS